MRKQSQDKHEEACLALSFRYSQTNRIFHVQVKRSSSWGIFVCAYAHIRICVWGDVVCAWESPPTRGQKFHCSSTSQTGRKGYFENTTKSTQFGITKRCEVKLLYNQAERTSLRHQSDTCISSPKDGNRPELFNSAVASCNREMNWLLLTAFVGAAALRRVIPE